MLFLGGLSYWQLFEIGTSTGTLSDDIGYLQQKPSLGFSLCWAHSPVAFLLVKVWLPFCPSRQVKHSHLWVVTLRWPLSRSCQFLGSAAPPFCNSAERSVQPWPVLLALLLLCCRCRCRGEGELPLLLAHMSPEKHR